MGRQYNYFISPEEEMDFTENLINKGYLILRDQRITVDNKDMWEWKILSIEDIRAERKCFLLKNTHGVRI